VSNLADRIRSEANIADRPGQMERLEAIANEVTRLEAHLIRARYLLRTWHAEAKHLRGEPT
jgi:hypothetical protein